jgi:hypothetical protein
MRTTCWAEWTDADAETRLENARLMHDAYDDAADDRGHAPADYDDPTADEALKGVD